MSDNSSSATKATSMRLGINELKQMVGEAINKQLLQEGPSEISVRMIMDEMKDVIVGSITEDLTRELPNKNEVFLEKVVEAGYLAMTREIIRNVDSGQGNIAASSGPEVSHKRKTVVFNPLNNPPSPTVGKAR